MSAELRLVRTLAGAALRRRAAGVVTVAVLIALLGGLAMSSVAAARRTQDAYPGYLAGSRASNLQVFPYSVRNNFGFVPVTVLDRIFSHLPLVTHVALEPSIYVVPTAEGNDPRAPFNSDEVQAVGSEGGEWFSVDRPAVVAGRMANPADPTEMVASKDAVALLHWHLGERVRFDAFTAAEASTSSTTPPPTRHVTLRLVGVVVFANEVARDDVDRYPTDVVVTPALTRELSSSVANVGFSLTLRGGDASVPAVEHEVQDALPPDSVYEFHVTSVVETAVEHAVEPASLALAAFGAFAAAACLVLAYQALRRLAASQATTLPVARALGAGRRPLVAAAAIPGLVAIAAGAAAAVVLAVAASPLAPIGTVRDVDPSPGFSADGLVLWSGAALVVLVLGLAAIALAAATLRRASRPAGSFARSRAGEAAARAGAPVTVVTGVRFALERPAGRGSSTYAVLVASVLAVAVAVATVTFGSSLRTLTTDPPLYGWNWDYAIISPADQSLPPAIGQALGRDPDVAAWAGYSYASVEIAGTTVPLDISVATDPAVGLALLAGHGIDGPRQIVLGAQTMASVHAHVGGWVVASYGSPSDYPVYVPPTRVRVVGEATMPAIGATDNLHTSMGVGAELPAGIEPPAFRAAITKPDKNLDGPEIVVIRLRHGVRRAAATAGLTAIAALGTRVMRRDPNAGYATYIVIGPQRPAEIAVYESTGSTPTLLATALGAGAVVALGVALAASVRRRRRDLALLKTLGLTRGQVAATISVQASIVALVGTVVGVPVGIAIGRWLWILFAHTIAAVPAPTVPVTEVVVIALVALALANVVAALPGRAGARTPVAGVLRAE